MKSRAAVALKAGEPLEIMEIDVQEPRKGEVLVRMVATGVCHTDAFTLSGEDPEGIFPSVLNTEFQQQLTAALPPLRTFNLTHL